MVVSLFALAVPVAAGADNAAALHERARQLVSQGHLSQALSVELEAVRSNPSDPLARRGLSYIYLRSGQIDKSVLQAQQATQLAPSDARAWFDLAMAQQTAGRPDLALPAFTRSWTLDQSSLPAATGIAQCLLGLGRASEAITLLEPLSHKYPQSTDLWMNLAASYFRFDDMDGARAAAASALKLSPNSWDATKIAAQIELADFEFQDARRLAARLIEIDPHQGFDYLFSARTYYENANDPDKVRQVIQQAKQNLPSDARMFQQFATALTLKGDNWGPRSLGGSLNLQQKWWHLAELSYTYALNADDRNVSIRIGLLQLLQKERKYVEAYDQAREITRIDPSNSYGLAAQNNLKFVDNDLAGLFKRQLKKFSGSPS